jgi:RNAse (barnase) inhibitor barstar
MEAMSKTLTDARRCGVFHLTKEPYEAEREAKAAGLAVFRMDIGHAHDKKDFLTHLAKGMHFPASFGMNWDALNDCLTDLDWIKGKGYVLIFEKSKHFAAGHKHEFDEAVEVLKTAADYWKDEGRPFWAFVHGAQGWDSGLPKWPT